MAPHRLHVLVKFCNYSGFYRTQYPASYTHKSLGRTRQFTFPASAGTQMCLLSLSLKSQIPKLFRNDSGFPIFTGYLWINRTGALVLDCCTDLVGKREVKTSVQTLLWKKVVKYHAFSQVRSAKKHGKRILICPSLTLCIGFFIVWISRPLKREGQLSWQFFFLFICQIT